MPAPIGTTRKLPYPLSRTVDMESETPDLPIDVSSLALWDSTDPDEKINVIMNLSLNEYVALANTIDVGRDIAYGDNSIEIWWIWVRSLQSMSICDAVTECILNNINTQNAIQGVIGGDPNINGNPNKWQQFAIESVPLCDDDTTWGYSKALWNFLNQQNVDFLEILDEATNTGEQISKMMSGIPLFGLLPFDEIVDWLSSLGEYNLDAYNASITTEINEEIWCELFCLAKENNCSLTFEQIWEYFLDKFGGANFPTLGATFSELVIYMITGSYLSDRIVYLWTLVQLGVAFIGGRFLGINSMNEIAVHAQTGDPDDDWILLCDTCGWTYNSTFETDDNSWFANTVTPYFTPQAQYAVVTGWSSVDVKINETSWDRKDDIKRTIASTHLDKVTLNYDMTKGTYESNATAIAVIADLDGGGTKVVTVSYDTAVNGAGQTLQLTVNDDAVGLRVLVRSSERDVASFDGACHINSVKVTGTGTNPF